MYKAIAGISALAVSAALGVTSVHPANATADVVVTAKISEHPDNGHGTPSHWATDSFTRTMRIHATSATTFELTTTDTGNFTTIKGAGRPAGAGGTISRILTGSFNSTGSGTATGTLIANPASKSGRNYDDVHGTPFPGSGAWANDFFTSGATVSPFNAYSFVYKTADEQWIDASTNNDGQDPAAGDISGKLSSLLTIAPCAGKTTQAWKVANTRGDRSRSFTYWSYYKGVKSVGAQATVSAGGSVQIHTAKSSTLGIHYYNGYNVSVWKWEHCA